MGNADSLKGHVDASDALVSVEEVRQELRAALSRLAADASPGIVERRAGTNGRRRANEFPRFQRYDRPGRRVA
jgi:hypothetical protein